MDDLLREWVQAPATEESSHVSSVDRQVTTLMPVQMEPFLNQHEFSKPLIYELYDFLPQSSDIPDHDFKLLFSNCPNADKDYLTFLNEIQREIFTIYKV